MLVDHDLLSIQHARIAAENAVAAQKALAALPQERLDAIVRAMGRAVAEGAEELAALSRKETDCGVQRDKLALIRFVCGEALDALLGLRCVGILSEDRERGLMDIGVPLGVIASLVPAANPAASTAHQALMAVKTGNAVIFSPHPRAARSTARTVHIMAEAAHAAGLPEGCLACLAPSCRSGARELMRHGGIALIVNTGVPSLLREAREAGKPLVYAGLGQGPAFIECSADIGRAARDIVRSKAFDNGMAPAAEQCVVAELCVAEAVRNALAAEGCHFMTHGERLRLGEVIRTCGGSGPGVMGLSADVLARRAGFAVPQGTRLLVAERDYVDVADPFSSEIMAPVLSFYVERDWRRACEKCVEVLLHEHKGHTLTIHSRDEAVIRQFALKKPVGRLLVNTPAVFGAIGMTTHLPPSVTLGSGSAGYGITADSVSPLHFIRKRKVGYGVRPHNLPQDVLPGLPENLRESLAGSGHGGDARDAADEKPLDARAVRALFGHLAGLLDAAPTDRPPAEGWRG
ncbi:MAG TPA: aldehyde dehydrogenase family protein [Candidatus Bilophila faecipullorum]|uniref:Aldehyde dehydrogenase family protein n=2 Tax=Bilophila TaxID=35832 RepID=A0A9D1QYS9_9BACT|nr:aldehyde dehydrogenase family protein [uncultured Bilophila sp.]HIW78408.1 aldehyde dehydrogenase family protein [Candidatus Bilophila faecipullorum]